MPLTATLHLGDGADAQLAALYDAMLARETNRSLGTAQPIADGTMHILQDAAERGGARLHVLTDSEDIARAATIVAASDRARYLTPGLHSEMIAEIRWPGTRYPRPESISAAWNSLPVSSPWSTSCGVPT